MTRARPENEVLTTWHHLNEFLRNANEADCEALLQEELGGLNRPSYVTRIRGRLTKLVTNRVRQELQE